MKYPVERPIHSFSKQDEQIYWVLLIQQNFMLNIHQIITHGPKP